MSWIHNLSQPHLAGAELKLFDAARKGKAFRALVSAIVSESPDILCTVASLKEASLNEFGSEGSFRDAIERHREGSPEVARGTTTAYLPNVSRKMEASREFTGAYPMNYRFVFCLLPLMVRKNGSYTRQQFNSDFPRKLVSRDTLDAVWGIWEAHARADRFGFTWSARSIVDPNQPEAFDRFFGPGPSPFERVRDEIFRNGPCLSDVLCQKTGLTQEELELLLKERGSRATLVAKRFFFAPHRGLQVYRVALASRGIRAAVLQISETLGVYTAGEMAEFLRLSPKSTALGDVLRTLVKEDLLEVEQDNPCKLYMLTSRVR